MDRKLWEVQTFAANLTDAQLEEIHGRMVAMLGAPLVAEIIETWEHELEEEDD